MQCFPLLTSLRSPGQASDSVLFIVSSRTRAGTSTEFCIRVLDHVLYICTRVFDGEILPAIAHIQLKRNSNRPSAVCTHYQFLCLVLTDA